MTILQPILPQLLETAIPSLRVVIGPHSLSLQPLPRGQHCSREPGIETEPGLSKERYYASWQSSAAKCSSDALHAGMITREFQKHSQHHVSHSCGV